MPHAVHFSRPACPKHAGEAGRMQENLLEAVAMRAHLVSRSGAGNKESLEQILCTIGFRFR